MPFAENDGVKIRWEEQGSGPPLLLIMGLGYTLDLANFCCPDYLDLMIERIRGNWKQQQEVPGAAVVKFTIQHDGRLTESSIERTSGYAQLDNAARRAIEVTRQLTPLPADYPNPTLTIHLTFQY